MAYDRSAKRANTNKGIKYEVAMWDYIKTGLLLLFALNWLLVTFAVSFEVFRSWLAAST